MNENRLSFGAETKVSTEVSTATNVQTIFDRPHIVQPGQK